MPSETFQTACFILYLITGIVDKRDSGVGGFDVVTFWQAARLFYRKQQCMALGGRVGGVAGADGLVCRCYCVWHAVCSVDFICVCVGLFCTVASRDRKFAAVVNHSIFRFVGAYLCFFYGCGLNKMPSETFRRPILWIKLLNFKRRSVVREMRPANRLRG